MGILDGLKPDKIWKYFEEIASIPHGSYHIDELSDHIAAFAEERGVLYVQDEAKNLILYLDATPGYENEPVLVLQGHMDMVAVNDDPLVDMSKTPIQLAHDEEYVFAKGSSLGGDDGIAVAMMMALADDADIPHPALDLLITTNEEVGMNGAYAFDVSLLRGNRFLNLDSEDEGIFTVGCAGGVKVITAFPLTGGPRPEIFGNRGFAMEITIDGLQGGHSGQLIHLGRANANCLMGRLLLALHTRFGAVLESINGGTASNAIADSATMRVVIPDVMAGEMWGPDSVWENTSGDEDLYRRAEQEDSAEGVHHFGVDEETEKDNGSRAELRQAVAEFIRLQEQTYRKEYHKKDDGLRITFHEDTEGTAYFTTLPTETERLARFLISEPDGVQSMSGVVEGLVNTSLNLGVLKTVNEKPDWAEAGPLGFGIRRPVRDDVTWEYPERHVRYVLGYYELRSMMGSSVENLKERVASIAAAFGAKTNISSTYPEWEYREESELRDKMVQVWKEMNGSEPRIEVIHAGLECGLFAKQIKEFDGVSMGPDMMDIHTTKEKLSIASVERTWEFLKKVLAKKD